MAQAKENSQRTAPVSPIIDSMRPGCQTSPEGLEGQVGVGERIKQLPRVTFELRLE